MNDTHKTGYSDENELANDWQKAIFQEAMTYMSKNRNRLTEKRCAWFRHLLLLIVTLFGILISLHTSTKSSPPIQWSYALAVVLLLLSILAGSISAYSEIKYQSQSCQMYVERALKAIRGGGKIGAVIVPVNKLFVVCEIVFYICVIGGIVLLTVHALLVNFT